MHAPSSEAEFYSWAAFGYGLNATLLGRPVAETGGMKATLSESVQVYANEVAMDELNHVRILSLSCQCSPIHVSQARCAPALTQPLPAMPSTAHMNASY